MFYSYMYIYVGITFPYSLLTPIRIEYHHILEGVFIISRGGVITGGRCALRQVFPLGLVGNK